MEERNPIRGERRIASALISPGLGCLKEQEVWQEQAAGWKGQPLWRGQQAGASPNKPPAELTSGGLILDPLIMSGLWWMSHRQN